MITIVKDGQSILDLALILTGATEGVWALALRNSLSVTETLECGKEIVWEYEDIADARIVDRYITEKICPATEVSQRTLDDLIYSKPLIDKLSYTIIDADTPTPQNIEPARNRVFSDEFNRAFG